MNDLVVVVTERCDRILDRVTDLFQTGSQNLWAFAETQRLHPYDVPDPVNPLFGSQRAAHTRYLQEAGARQNRLLVHAVIGRVECAIRQLRAETHISQGRRIVRNQRMQSSCVLSRRRVTPRWSNVGYPE